MAGYGTYSNIDEGSFHQSSVEIFDIMEIIILYDGKVIEGASRIVENLTVHHIAAA